jgi:hypothetical protein
MKDVRFVSTDFPWAMIEKWGPGDGEARTVVVRCPFCKGRHGHGLPNGKLEGSEHRVADCGLGLGYYLADENTVALTDQVLPKEIEDHG